MKQYFVYMMTNQRHTVLYTGMTNNLVKRVLDHICKANPKSFTARYNVDKLVYYSYSNDVHGAISEEKRIKKLTRKNKEKLINEFNPEWRDLAEDIGITKEDIEVYKKFLRGED